VISSIYQFIYKRFNFHGGFWVKNEYVKTLLVKKLKTSTTVVIPVVEVNTVVVDGVPPNVTVGVTVKVCETTVDTVDKNGANVVINSVVVVVNTNDVIVVAPGPEIVTTWTCVETIKLVVLFIDKVDVDENPKFVTTISVVEKLNDVRADLVCVELLVVVVLIKLV
jgi:hypothetical protein